MLSPMPRTMRLPLLATVTTFAAVTTAVSLWGCGSETLFSAAPALSGSGGAGGGQGPGSGGQGPGAQGPGGGGAQGPGGGGAQGPGGGGAQGPGGGGAQGPGGGGAQGPGGGGVGGAGVGGAGVGGGGPICGNNIAEGGEFCDGTDLGGHDCQDFGYVNPAGMTCTGCMLNGDGCAPSCNGVVEPTEPCDDGNDNPFDGCDECVLVNSPVGSCQSPIPVTAGPGLTTVSGNTTTGGSQSSDLCQGEVMARDIVYAVTPSVDGFISGFMSDVEANYDSMLYVMQSCGDTTSGIVCADNFPNGKETLSFRVSAGTTYHVVVDGWGGDEGAFTLNLVLSAGTCADPVVFPLWPGVGMRAVGSTLGLSNNHLTSTCGGALSEDVVYAVVPQYTGKLEARIVSAATNYNAVLSARSTCNSLISQIACDVDNGNGDEVISVDATMGTPVYVWVDGWNSADGNYRLDLSPP